MDAANHALRPFLWLAAVAFLVGFVSYLALGRQALATAQAEPEAWPAQVSAPASDEWNIPKHI